MKACSGRLLTLFICRPFFVGCVSIPIGVSFLSTIFLIRQSSLMKTKSLPTVDPFDRPVLET